MEMKLNKVYLPEFIKARNNYFIAFALDDTNKAIDVESKKEVLKENVFYSWDYSRTSEKKIYKQLTNYKADYTLSNNDFIKYLKLTHKKHIEKGLILPYHKYAWAKDEPYNLSVDCETRLILREAEKVLIACSLDILPKELKTDFKDIDLISNYTTKQKYLKLVLSLNVGDIPTTEQLLNEVC